MYNMLICNLYKEHKCVQKWKEVLNLEDFNMESIFTRTTKVTKDTRVRWFQYRLIHRILPTNTFLFQINIFDSPLCRFCNLENETYTCTHLFNKCNIVKKFLTDVKQWVEETAYIWIIGQR